MKLEVAKNTSTSPDFLRTLAQDKNPSIRYAVIENPSTPLGVIEHTVQAYANNQEQDISV